MSCVVCYVLRVASCWLCVVYCGLCVVGRGVGGAGGGGHVFSPSAETMLPPMFVENRSGRLEGNSLRLPLKIVTRSFLHCPPSVLVIGAIFW